MRDAMLENVVMTNQKNVSKKHSVRLPEIKNFSQTVIPSKLPPGLSPTEDSIISDWLCTSNVPRIINYRFPAEKYTIPATTSQEVGWPWLRQETPVKQDPCAFTYKREYVPHAPTLEKFGKYARGQGDVLKWFGVRESLP
jgi:hypothetical protein